jgi:hypothetical protein
MPFQSRSIRKLAGLPDYLVRLKQHHLRYRDPEGLGRLQVDHQLKLHRLLHGEVGRLAAFQNAIHIVGGAPIPVRGAFGMRVIFPDW